MHRTPLAPLLALVALVLSLTTACATSPPIARTETYAATGVFVRHLRLRIAPAQTRDFEALMERCVAAAAAARLPEGDDWLCYRESPGRYWIVTFADERDAPAVTRRPAPLRAFVRRIAGAGRAAGLAEAERRLAELEYVVEWNLLMRVKHDWSTVVEMATAEHPKARMMRRTVRPGREADFERALTARTAFFREHGYPLPIEGFVVLEGLPGNAIQLVFPRDWRSFHATESFWEFVQSRPEDERADYAARKAALMETMASAEYHEADFVPAASFGGV